MHSVLQKAWLGLSDKSRYPLGFRFRQVSFRFRFFLRLLMKETEAEDLVSSARPVVNTIP